MHMNGACLYLSTSCVCKSELADERAGSACAGHAVECGRISIYSLCVSPSCSLSMAIHMQTVCISHEKFASRPAFPCVVVMFAVSST